MASWVPRFAIQSLGGPAGPSRSVMIAACFWAIVKPILPEIMKTARRQSMDSINGWESETIESPSIPVFNNVPVVSGAPRSR